MHQQLGRSIAIGIGVSLAILLAINSPATAQENSGMIVYFGTSTSPKSQGIYMARWDEKSGALSAPQLAACSAAS